MILFLAALSANDIALTTSEVFLSRFATLIAANMSVRNILFTSAFRLEDLNALLAVFVTGMEIKLVISE